LAKVTTGSLEALQLYSQAKDAMDHGKLDQALAPLQGALKLDPDFAMAHVKLGDYYSSIVGKNEKAVAEYQRAYELRQDVTDRERLWIEASYFSIHERYEDSVQSLNVLVSLYPDDSDVHVALAEAYDNVARPDKTIAELRQILKLNSLSVTAYVKLIDHLARSNANQEAIAVHAEARQRGLDAPDLHRGMGLAYWGLGQLSEARDEFRKLAQAGQPYKDLGEFYLAKTETYEGKQSAARAHLDAIIQRDLSTHTIGLRPVGQSLLASRPTGLGAAPGKTDSRCSRGRSAGL
jgi:tetratricopeptide (TPR) repeat protein